MPAIDLDTYIQCHCVTKNTLDFIDVLCRVGEKKGSACPITIWPFHNVFNLCHKYLCISFWLLSRLIFTSPYKIIHFIHVVKVFVSEFYKLVYSFNFVCRSVFSLLILCFSIFFSLLDFLEISLFILFYYIQLLVLFYASVVLPLPNLSNFSFYYY